MTHVCHLPSVVSVVPCRRGYIPIASQLGCQNRYGNAPTGSQRSDSELGGAWNERNVRRARILNARYTTGGPRAHQELNMNVLSHIQLTTVCCMVSNRH